MGNGCTFIGPKDGETICNRHNAHYNQADVSKFFADWEFLRDFFKDGHPIYAVIGYLALSIAGWIWWWRCRLIDVTRGKRWTIGSFFGARV